MIAIQRANREDLPEILALQYLAYQSEAKLLQNPNIPPLKQTLSQLEEEFVESIILKAIEDGAIIGSVRGRVSNGTVFIGKLMVHPEKQNRGFGTKLLHAIEQQFPDRRYELFTSVKSRSNIAFYEKSGYTIFTEKQITEDLRLVYLEK